MKIFLLRHAARDPFTTEDAGLNALGKKQAQEFAQLLLSSKSAIPTRLLASPRRRSQETLQPLRTGLGLDLLIKSELDERQEHESHEQFIERINMFLNRLEDEHSPADIVVACTHYDWLEEALIQIPSDLSETQMIRGFSHCEFLAFEVENSFWRSLQGSLK